MSRTRIAWDAVVRVAHDIADYQVANGGRPVVTTRDLVERLGICRDTATRYIERLRRQEGWEPVRLPSRGGRPGPAPRAVRQTEQ